MIHLDANYLITALPAHSPNGQKVRQWLSGAEQIGTSVMAWAEWQMHLAISPDQIL